MLLASLLLPVLALIPWPPATQEAPPELSPAWTQDLIGAEPPSLVGAPVLDVFEDLILTASTNLSSGSADEVWTHLLSATGTELWRMSETDAVPGTQIDTVVAVAFSIDGQFAYSFVEEGQQAFGQAELRARRVSDGSLVWNRKQTVSSFYVDAGAIEVTSQAVVVSRTESDKWGIGGTLLNAYDPAIGSNRWSQYASFQYPRPLASSDAAGLVLVGPYISGTTVRAMDTGTGITQWAHPGNLSAVVDEAGARAFLGDSTLGVVARDLATGSELWTRSGVAPKSMSMVGARVLVQEPAGSTMWRFLMLDGATGSELWDQLIEVGSQFSSVPVASDGVGTTFALRTASSSAGASAFRRYDATTGALLTEIPLGIEPAPLAHTQAGPIGGWALSSSVTPAALGLAEQGGMLWSFDPLAAASPGTEILWMESRPQTGSVHLVWQHLNWQQDSPFQARYESRSATTGQLLASFDLEGIFEDDAEFALSPDASEIGFTGYLPTGLGSSRFERRRTSDGVVVFSILPPPHLRVRLVWTADGAGLVAAREYLGTVFLENYAVDGQLNYQTALNLQPASTDNELTEFRRLQGTDDLFVAVYERQAVGGLTSLTRADASTGAISAQSLLNLEAAPGEVLEERVVAMGEDSNGRLVLATEVIDRTASGPAIDRTVVVAVDAQTLGVQEVQELSGSVGSGPQFGVVPLAIEPMSQARVVVVRSEDATGARLDAFRLEPGATTETWQRTLRPGSVVRAHIVLSASGREAFILHSNDTGTDLEHSLWSVDTTFGSTLFESNALAQGGSSASWLASPEIAPGLTAASGVVVVAAKASSDPLDFARLLGFGVGELLDGAESLSLSAPEPVPLIVERGPEAAGRIFVLLGSATGTDPGFPFEQVLVPLVIDGYTTQILQSANGPVFQGTIGILDAQGSASATVAVPGGLSPSLVGLTLFHAAIDFEPGLQIDGVTNATSFKLVP